MLIRSLILMLCAALFALPVYAQDKQTNSEILQQKIGEQEFIASMRREQVIRLAKEIEEKDSQLKWVLDNWVPKQNKTK